MSNYREEPITGGAETTGSRFHTLQPLRDLESNWAVDLAKNLEDYLLKICSGEVPDDHTGQLSVNFAEAALLLQGSVQVYSRKVEYLYSLVLHALDFVSDKRQNEQPGGASSQSEENPSHAGHGEENDQFWGLDDIPVDAKNSLDSTTCKDSQINNFVKPPANLVVLEGDCLDSAGDGSELESYLLATTDLYRDFILLDPCDAIAVNHFLKNDESGKTQNDNCRRGSLTSKSRKSFLSPSNRSGGNGCKSSARKNEDAHPNQSPPIDHGIEPNYHNNGPDPVANETYVNNFNDFEMDDRYSEPGDVDDEDDEDDPWKPLNPHEPGTLRVKPFKKVKFSRRQIINTHKRIPITREFPLARMHGAISSELTAIWEALHCASESQEPQFPPFYEKLRDSLLHGAHEKCNTFGDPKDGNKEYDDDDDNVGLDFDPPDFDNPENQYKYDEVPMHSEKHDGGDAYFNNHEFHGQDDSASQPNLEDLCRSHLDSLLASIAETEKQTELAFRVSTWKQRIEKNLEEQDSRPPFDIHEYGERVMEKLPLEADSVNAISFTNVVSGQEKHDVARTFSALLQLVNNGNVDLVKNSEGSEPTCYTGENPFHIRFLSHDKRPEKVILRPSKKRAKSPAHRGFGKDKGNNSVGKEKQISSSPLNSKLSIKVKKMGSVRCTPEGKRRRTRLVEPVDLQFAG